MGIVEQELQELKLPPGERRLPALVADDMAVRVLAHERLAVAEVAIAPADVEARAHEGCGAPLQRARPTSWKPMA